MLLAVVSGFLLALAAPSIRQALEDRAGWVLALLPAGLFIYFAQFLGPIGAGETLVFSQPWITALDINLSFYVDGLSLTFALLISGIGTFIIIYAGGYLKGHPNLGRFFSFLLMFMGSMLGLVLADNVITLFVFWELTSITSFLLISFDNGRPAARRAALQALVVTGGGGLALLAGLILMAQVGGSLEMSELLSQNEVLTGSPAYLAIMILVLAGAFTKSAQVPFHFWLPNAMEAPTPVSAFLHSATMVKAGVYLLARVNPALGGTDIWSWTLILFGCATFVLGTVLALRNTDLKLMLAQTTVASLGLLVMLIGLGHHYAFEAAALYLVAHSLFKGCLFMVAGCVDHETGTRQQPDLGGLRPLMPITAAAALLAGLSMSGIPPFFGFIAKEFIYKATTDGDLALLVTAASVLANALMLAVAALVALKPFIGELAPTPKTPHEGPLSLYAGPVVLAVIGLVFGIFNFWPEKYLIGPTVASISGQADKVDIYLWGGVNLALGLSIVTIALGLLIYWFHQPIRARLIRIVDATWGPDTGYDQFMDGLVAGAGLASRATQTGVMRHYMFVTFLSVALVLALPRLFGNGVTPSLSADLTFYHWAVFIMAAGGAIQVVMARTPLVAVVSMGILGVSVALIFLMFGAPDLAFTQLMVETLSVVILTLVIARMPMDSMHKRSTVAGVADVGIASVVGIFMALLLMSVVSGTLDLRLSDYFAKHAYPDAYGRNIVNVILVDFRALDTLGEILVVVIAGVSALSLIEFGARRPITEAIKRIGRQREESAA